MSEQSKTRVQNHSMFCYCPQLWVPLPRSPTHLHALFPRLSSSPKWPLSPCPLFVRRLPKPKLQPQDTPTCWDLCLLPYLHRGSAPTEPTPVLPAQDPSLTLSTAWPVTAQTCSCPLGEEVHAFPLPASRAAGSSNSFSQLYYFEEACMPLHSAWFRHLWRKTP